jgi:DNA-binding HxlR family transcriptional regulator
MSIQLRQEIEQRFRKNDFFCEKELTMAVISGKYKIVIIWHLGHEGPLRYGQIFKLFPGISDRILTKQLRELEYDDIVEREVFPVVPPKVEYRLTANLGNSILPIVDEMWRWGRANMKFYHEKLLEKDRITALKAESAAKTNSPRSLPVNEEKKEIKPRKLLIARAR